MVLSFELSNFFLFFFIFEQYSVGRIKPLTMCWLTQAVLFYGLGERIHMFRVPTQKCMFFSNIPFAFSKLFNARILPSINSTFSVGYGIGGVQGIAYRDTVVIGDATGHNQLIGAANKTSGFNLVRPIDGIRTSLRVLFFLKKKKKQKKKKMNCALTYFVLTVVGLGPSNSNGGDISGFSNTPTFVETLVAQNQISEPVFGIYIAPLGADGTPQGSGEITFGGIDKSKIQGG